MELNQDPRETIGHMYSLVLVNNAHFETHPNKGSLSSIEDCSIDTRYLTGVPFPINIGDIFEDERIVIYTVVDTPRQHIDLRNDRLIYYVPVSVSYQTSFR